MVHKEKGSKNCEKRKEIAICHERIANTRKDYQHKIFHEIMSENQVIVAENLRIKNMEKKSTIICGNIIGKYAMVAAGAVVTRDVEAYTLVAGVPAKAIGKVDEQGNIVSRM